MKPFIIIDTREQLPYWNFKQCARMTLNVGDYTTVKLLNKFHIERKSAQDLYGTLTKGNVRFKKEIWRAWDNDIELVIVVECSKKDFIAKNFPRGDLLKFPSHGLKKMIATFEGEQYGLEFIWCRGRVGAMSVVKNRLKKEESKL